MFDIAPTELMLVALVALVVIGPKDLPRLMRVVGQWVARARGMARHFRSGMDEMIRQAEIEEMERKWAEENARIMREHPPMRDEGAPQMTPLADTDGASVAPAAPDGVNGDHDAAGEHGAPVESVGHPAALNDSGPVEDAGPVGQAPGAATAPPASQAELPLGPVGNRPA